MSDPFASANLLLKRAKRDFAKLERRAQRVIANQTYELFTEPDPARPEDFVKFKMRLVKELPDAISEFTGNIVNNLRFALDHALSAVAVAAGCTKPRAKRNAYFPFSGNEAKFESNLAGRCADVPKEIWPLIRKYRPYKGGEDFLFALNEVCNANKHDLVIPVGTVTQTTGISAHGLGFMQMPYPGPVWDSDKKEMELFTLHRTQTQQFKCNFKFAESIIFGEVGIISGQSVLPNLEGFIKMVEIILREMHAEARILGIVK